MNSAAAAWSGEFRGGYPHFQEETLEWVGTAAGDRHLREVAFRLILRKSRRAGVGDRSAGTGWDPWKRDLAPPAPNLHHQNISQVEPSVGTGQRNHQG